MYYSVVVFGLRHAILRRRYYTRLLRVEISKVRRVLNVGHDICVLFDTGLCRTLSSILSNVYEFHFVSKLYYIRSSQKRTSLLLLLCFLFYYKTKKILHYKICIQMKSVYLCISIRHSGLV